MKKNNNIKSILVSGIILFIIIITLYFIFLKSDDNKIKIDPYILEQSTLYNTIYRNASKLEDYKKCEQIKIENIKNICIATVKSKFHPMHKFTSVADCRTKLKIEKGQIRDHEENICLYNVAYRLANKKDDLKWCDMISDYDKSTKKICKIMLKSKLNIK